MFADDLVATGTNAEVIETFKCQSCRYILHSGYDVCWWPVATGTNAEVIETFKCQSCRYILHSGYDGCWWPGGYMN